MALAKTKTIGKGSESFLRELDNSEFVLDEEREKDLKFIKSQPERGKKILQYFIRTGLKYKEVFDAIHIGDLPIAKQVEHKRAIAALLVQNGWQGKVDLHTRPHGVYDHPSPHFHLWGSQITKEVYNLVKNYLLENDLTDETRLKTMKAAKKIEKLSREDLALAKQAEEQKSAEPAPLEIRSRKSGAARQIKAFVEQNRGLTPEAVAAVERVAQKQSDLRSRIDALKNDISGKETLAVRPSAARQEAVDSKFEEAAKSLHDRIARLKANLSSNI